MVGRLTQARLGLRTSKHTLVCDAMSFKWRVVCLSGRPDAALVGVLARNSQAAWAAALLQPSAGELPLLLPALLSPLRSPGDPTAAPAPGAAAAGSAGASARAGPPVGGATGEPGDGPGRAAPVLAADMRGRAALLAQFPWARVPRAGAREVLAPLAALADELAGRTRAGAGSAQGVGATVGSLLGVHPASTRQTWFAAAAAAAHL